MNQQEWEFPHVSMRPMGVQSIPLGAAEWQPSGAAFGPAGAGAPPLMPQLQRQLMQVLRALESVMPVAEVLHSLHTEAERDPAIRELPAMKRFSESGVTELHSMVAAAGYIRRILSGDRSPAVLAGLQDQLAALHAAHRDAGSALTQVTAAPEARANPAVQALSQVAALADQAYRAVMAMVEPLMTIAMPAER